MVMNTEILKETVYNLCLTAAQNLSGHACNVIKKEYEKHRTLRLANILENAKYSAEKGKPICQDTGTVHVFLNVGNLVSFSSNPYDAINEGVSKCYKENFVSN